MSGFRPGPATASTGYSFPCWGPVCVDGPVPGVIGWPERLYRPIFAAVPFEPPRPRAHLLTRFAGQGTVHHEQTLADFLRLVPRLAAALLLGVASCGDPTDIPPGPTYQVFAGGKDNVLLGYDGEEWKLLTTTPGTRDPGSLG